MRDDWSPLSEYWLAWWKACTLGKPDYLGCRLIRIQVRSMVRCKGSKQVQIVDPTHRSRQDKSHLQIGSRFKVELKTVMREVQAARNSEPYLVSTGSELETMTQITFKNYIWNLQASLSMLNDKVKANTIRRLNKYGCHEKTSSVNYFLLQLLFLPLSQLALLSCLLHVLSPHPTPYPLSSPAEISCLVFQVLSPGWKLLLQCPSTSVFTIPPRYISRPSQSSFTISLGCLIQAFPLMSEWIWCDS